MSTKKDNEKIHDNRQQIYQSYHAYMTQEHQPIQQEQVSYSAADGRGEQAYQNPYYYNWPHYYYPYYYGNNPIIHPFYINQNNPNENTQGQGQGQGQGQAAVDNNNDDDDNNNNNRLERDEENRGIINRKHKIGSLHFRDSNGVQPLFINALHVISVAVLLITFPLTLIASGYVGPGAFVFACGPMAAIFSFWAVYITPCECFPNIEWAVQRIKIFATIAAIFDVVGAIGSPLSLHDAQCPDDDDTMLTCDDQIVTSQGIAIATSCALAIHAFLCLLVRSNAHRLAESKFEVLDGAYNIMMDSMDNHPTSDHNLNEELMTRN